MRSFSGLRQFATALLATGALVFLGSCGGRHVFPLTSQKFPAATADAEVKLFVNEVERPHIKLAYVRSYTAKNELPETKRAQLLDIQKRARKLGADAIMGVTLMKTEVLGFVEDEKTPFPSLEQGEYSETFLRGTAIKFVTEEEAKKAYKEAFAEGYFRVPENGDNPDEGGKSSKRGIGSGGGKKSGHGSGH